MDAQGIDINDHILFAQPFQQVADAAVRQVFLYGMKVVGSTELLDLFGCIQDDSRYIYDVTEKGAGFFQFHVYVSPFIGLVITINEISEISQYNTKQINSVLFWQFLCLLSYGCVKGGFPAAGPAANEQHVKQRGEKHGKGLQCAGKRRN